MYYTYHNNNNNNNNSKYTDYGQNVDSIKFVRSIKINVIP